MEVTGFFVFGLATLELSGASVTASNIGIIKRQGHIVLLISLAGFKRIALERITS
jgi:hypothetical protein